MPVAEPSSLIETGQVERAARRAIARAKRRGSTEVTADDLLVGALEEVSRFGVAWIGDWAVDVAALDGATETSGTAAPEGAGSAPAYGADAVGIFERAAAIAREDGSASLGLVHLLVAFAGEECGVMTELRRRHGLSAADWRAALARGRVGLSPRLAGVLDPKGDGGRGGAGSKPDILSVEDAASYLGVHAQTVRNYIRGGKLPAYRLAGERYIRVLRKDLLALLERVRTDEPEVTEEST